VANWYATTDDLGWLNHTWSLGIEEQFYIAWPLVVIPLARYGRQVLFSIAIVGAGLAVVLRTVLFEDAGADVSRWTHTRADALLLGCALAVVLHMRASGRTWPRIATAALVGLLTVALLEPTWIHTHVPSAAALLAALVVVATARGDYQGWLSAGWLRLVGRRSYGLYLWHVPVFNLIYREQLPWIVALPVALMASWVAALLSWRFIERPFLRLKSRSVETTVGSHRNADPELRSVPARHTQL
jgi:peptidoglycan/LPS O-acetylase OafA/YrhL